MEINISKNCILNFSSVQSISPASLKVARTVLNLTFPYKDKGKLIKEISVTELKKIIEMPKSKYLYNKFLVIKNDLEKMGENERWFKAVYYKDGIYTFYLTEAGSAAGNASGRHIHFDSSVWEYMDSTYSLILYERLKGRAAEEPEPVLTISAEDFKNRNVQKMNDLYRVIKRAVDQVNQTDIHIIDTKYKPKEIEIKASI